MACEMCGKEESLFQVMVEGTTMRVCKACSRFGKVLQAPANMPKRQAVKKEEVVVDVVEDCAQRIRAAREAAGLTQKEFALKLNEKETVVQKWETGTLRPSMDAAGKLERVLKIKLLEEKRDEAVSQGKARSDALTIGDILKQKN